VRNLTGHAVALLAAVHATPGLTRVDAARQLGIGTGAMTELVARLAGANLLAEQPAAPRGTRGRPTTELVAHPDGPLVLAAAIFQESWQVDVVALGGQTLASTVERHRAVPGDAVLAAIADTARRFRRRFAGRIQGVGVSAPGTVRDGQVLDAANLGWRDLDLRAIWPRAELFVADNDATLAALAESRRGAAVDAATLLHLQIEGGLGGAVLEQGAVLRGAQGVAGEFGHMPFGDPAVRCPCGAQGCWGTAVDGTALARRLGAPEPRDPVTYGRAVLARAAAGAPDERQAAGLVAQALGRGIAGLVNGLDPDLVTLSGLGLDILAVAPDELAASYVEGLMEFRRARPPEIIAARLREAGPLVGAAEEVWTRVWSRLSV
jgi:predicted NBD/HSP70 family sugar kinase